MECPDSDSDYEKMATAIKQALDDYAIANPDEHVAVMLTITTPIVSGSCTVSM